MKSLLKEDVSTILSWSDVIEEPFDYKKDTVNGNIYYLVFKEINKNEYETEMTYYLVTWDDYLNKGYTHKLPVLKNYDYNEKSIKEIVNFIFKADQDFKRINERVICRECDFKEGLHSERVIYRKLTVNGVENIEEIRPNCFAENSRLIDEEMKYKTKHRIYNNYFRKNISIEGDTLILDTFGFNFYENCKIYSNGKEIFSSKTPVTFNKIGNGIKIRNYLYYEPVTYSLDYEIKYEEVHGYALVSNIGELLKIYINTNFINTKKKVFIGNYEVNGKIFKTEGLCSTDYQNNLYPSYIICIGKFELIDELGNIRTYGKDNKAYILTNPIRYYEK